MIPDNVDLFIELLDYELAKLQTIHAMTRQIVPAATEANVQSQQYIFWLTHEIAEYQSVKQIYKGEYLVAILSKWARKVRRRRDIFISTDEDLTFMQAWNEVFCDVAGAVDRAIDRCQHA